MTESPGILCLSIDGLLSPLGQSQILSYGLRLSKEGFRFHFISMEQKQELQDNKRVSQLRSVLAEVGAEWTPLPYRTSQEGRFTRFSNVQELYRAASKVISAGRIQLVHARSYLPAFVANRLRGSHAVPYLFDMRGCWIEECREQGRAFMDPLTYWIGKRVERRLVANAAGIVTLTALQAKDLGLVQDSSKPISRVIRTCCDRQQFARIPDALERIPANAADRLRGKIVICWVGSINSAYLLTPSLELFKKIHSLDSNAVLLGLTKQVREMREAALSLGIAENHMVIASVAYEEMPTWLSCARWGLLLMQNTPARRGAMPTKLAEFLAAGVRPIHFGCNEEVTQMVQKSAFGVTMGSVEPDEMQRVSEMITRQNHSGESPQIGTSILDEFDLDTGVRKYASVYKELLERSAPVK